MANPTFGKTEIVGTSPTSFADAVANGVAKAAETTKNLSWFEVAELRGSIHEGKVQQYQVTMRLGHRLD